MSTNSTNSNPTNDLPIIIDGTSRRCPTCSADALDNFHVAFGPAQNASCTRTDARRRHDFHVVADCTACGQCCEVDETTPARLATVSRVTFRLRTARGRLATTSLRITLLPPTREQIESHACAYDAAGAWLRSIHPNIKIDTVTDVRIARIGNR